MKIVKLMGGLGNQMFQYMFGQYLSKKYNEKIYYDVEFFKHYSESEKLEIRNIELLKFNFDIEIVDYKKYPFLNYNNRKEKFIYLLKGLLSLNRNTFNFVSDSKFTLISKVFSIFFRNNYYIGYWQAYRYILDLEFKLKDSQNLINTKVKEKILNSNAVSIGVRRGDYVKLGAIICDIEYYKKAINLIDKKLDNPVFYIFSDDIEWCRKNIKSSDKYFFVEANKDTPFENMELMSLCKHNIISNSTYEWWGAFLNKNKQKIVIYPKKWKFYETKKNKLIPSEWIKI
jgi:hypothetical protein|tara:strand:+ start:900 stop:1757 length:858 start_codon:yes stop_codon:yes gene_type:complete